MERLERGDRSPEMKHVSVNDYPALLGDVLIEKIFLKGHNARVKKCWRAWNEEIGSYSCPEPRCVISAGRVRALL